MEAVEPNLPTLYPAVRIMEGHMPRANGFHLRALKFDSRLKGLKNLELVPCLTVTGRNFLPAVSTTSAAGRHQENAFKGETIASIISASAIQYLTF
jgi:hypothetical protein